ncbi:MAG: hypothetical protein A2622_00985 [Bdellovibrionales bacterium RIFCSPHIGHO2_01_FULL_40_29]|nr:MAG: hypothetical protein A2622_00985 [Bdellovibrionales bacterium RIFCSPHIGHO2_01_FULL_40_29]OFZ32689.1 MAG: hypothetical protein A3D17_05585 [Bdellovibrionales bacterium RIFCSPHIGHO2_02_FULL_40_15]
MTNFLIGILILLNTSQIRNQEYLDFWIIWNVGQGQWISHILSDRCLHYDSGGEFFSFPPLKKRVIPLCRSRQNQLFLSHWDLDHINFIPSLIKLLPRLCWQAQPPPLKMTQLITQVKNLKIPFCVDSYKTFQTWNSSLGKTANDRSWVYQDRQVLIPGDSTSPQEKLWSKQMTGLNQIQILILGHHGSQSSTNQALLSALPKLKLAIASAREARYRHPHAKVMKRLQKNKTPVLKTEDWGSIWIF